MNIEFKKFESRCSESQHRQELNPLKSAQIIVPNRSGCFYFILFLFIYFFFSSLRECSYIVDELLMYYAL